MHYRIDDHRQETRYFYQKNAEESYDFSVGNFSTLETVVLADKDASINVSVDIVGTDSSVLCVVLVMSKDARISVQTYQHHRVRNGKSTVLVKSVLYGESQFSFEGIIRLEKEAQMSNAYQRNENLVLSESALVHSKPTLEILANDVRCTHGATTGGISEDQLWYMASRGLPEQNAKKTIARGFLQSGMDSFSDEGSIRAAGKILDTWV